MSALVSTLISASVLFCTLGHSMLAWSTDVPKLENTEQFFVFTLSILSNYSLSLLTWNDFQIRPLGPGEIGGKSSTHQRLFLLQQRNYGSLPEHSQNKRGMEVSWVQNALKTLERGCFLDKYVYCSWDVFAPPHKLWLLVQPRNHRNCGRVW